ncbi:MAG: hypothetical protein HUJ59_05280, partial [Bacilli bacterium]|nr:hypothetical protein [Bacilli bacterium]
SDITKNVNWWKEFSYEVKQVYPQAFLVGENFDGWGTRTSPYYAGLDSQFDFSNYYHVPAWIYNSEGGASCFNEAQAAETYVPFAQYRSDFINGAFTSNHDVMRLMNAANGTGNHEGTTPAQTVSYGNATANSKAKMQAAVTILNPGCSWIYYGDELGMTSNTEKHIEKYGNENCLDIWYRQPFLWNDLTKRPHYKSGQYDFELDSHNKSISNNGEGITYVEGKVTTTNEFYSWYKALIEIKNKYPKGAKVEYKNCGINVLVMHVTGSGSELYIYINMGMNTNQYLMNPGSGFTNIATLNGAPTNAGGDIGAKKYSVSAFIKN